MPSYYELDDESTKKRIDITLQLAKEADMEEKLIHLGKEEWRTLVLNLPAIALEFQNAILMYQANMPAEIRNKLIRVVPTLNKMKTALSIFDSLFMFKEEDWTTRKEEHKTFYLTICEDFAETLIRYAHEIYSLRSSILNTKAED